MGFMSGSGYNIKKFETANILVSKNEFGRISHYFVVKNWFFEIFDENKNPPSPLSSIKYPLHPSPTMKRRKKMRKILHDACNPT